MEQQIKLAAKIYKCRDTAKRLYGDRYEKTIAFYRGVISEYIQQNGGGELEAVIALSERYKGNENEGIVIMNLTAAAAELLEPSFKTPTI